MKAGQVAVLTCAIRLWGPTAPHGPSPPREQTNWMRWMWLSRIQPGRLATLPPLSTLPPFRPARPQPADLPSPSQDALGHQASPGRGRDVRAQRDAQLATAATAASAAGGVGADAGLQGPASPASAPLS